MTLEIFKSVSFDGAFETPSDIWILLDPDNNPWTESVDWELGLLIRRSRHRQDKTPNAPLLLATPQGWLSPRLLVLFPQGQAGGGWLPTIHQTLTKMRAKTATILPPHGSKPPAPKELAELSQGEWGIRWVDSKSV